ncbi:LytR/AlgR family response regulator transcription factor [Psychroserpens ponticola]|uniref:Response regulator n=1 Tax=Psychroserpens ponticola TaxID=2932268 RepID=A0ABY7RZZ9_9FLAO|nr:response regulator [Psychroserpens ponticola]WCO02708.1 response regulator [Psychroserpens ponticola]
MSETISVLIVEDEFLTVDAIKDNLEDVGYRISGIARDAKEALSILDEGETDIAILDMNIQGARDGIWLAKRIKESYKIPFIFLTAYSDKKTVKSAVETQPFGYLIKPFKKMDLFTSIEVALRNFVDFQFNTELDIQSTIKEKPLAIEDYIFIKEKNIYKKIAMKDILYIKSELKYIEVYVGTKKYLLRYGLSEFLKTLPENHFIQVHRSYIVNKNAVDQIGINYLVIKENEIPFSNQRKEEIIKMFHFL